MQRIDGQIQVHRDEANELAQLALGYKVVDKGEEVQIHLLEPEDWRADIFNYLKDSAQGVTQEDKVQGNEVCPDRR